MKFQVAVILGLGFVAQSSQATLACATVFAEGTSNLKLIETNILVSESKTNLHPTLTEAKSINRILYSWNLGVDEKNVDKMQLEIKNVMNVFGTKSIWDALRVLEMMPPGRIDRRQAILDTAAIQKDLYVEGSRMKVSGGLHVWKLHPSTELAVHLNQLRGRLGLSVSDLINVVNETISTLKANQLSLYVLPNGDPQLFQAAAEIIEQASRRADLSVSNELKDLIAYRNQVQISYENLRPSMTSSMERVRLTETGTLESSLKMSAYAKKNNLTSAQAIAEIDAFISERGFNNQVYAFHRTQAANAVYVTTVVDEFVNRVR